MSAAARHRLVFLSMGLLVVLLLPCGLLTGSVALPAADVLRALAGAETDEVTHLIVVESRLPALLAAFFGGMALAVAGLLMQTTFSNPLAGPSVMGVSSGGSLGVALVLMAVPAVLGSWGRLALVGGAFVGAMIVITVLIGVSAVLRSSPMLLIVGILIGYLASAAISILNFFSPAEGVHSFVLWGLGSFSGVSMSEMPLYGGLCLLLTAASFLFLKALDALLLGERTASTVGVNVQAARTWLLLLSGALTAVVTAWCGPIGFIGLAVPHIARLCLGSGSHRVHLPATALCGGAVGLLCQVLSVAPASAHGILPVNAVTPLVGIPVIIYVILRGRGRMER